MDSYPYGVAILILLWVASAADEKWMRNLILGGVVLYALLIAVAAIVILFVPSPFN